MIHFLVNGFPLYFSDTAEALPWADGEVLPWLIDGRELLRAVRYYVEPWGGCVKGPELTVTIADAGMALSRLLPLAHPLDAVVCTEYIVVPTLSGEVVADVSDNSTLSVGEILQCPLDAWEILQVGPAELPSGIRCRRGVYSCFPVNEWIYQPYYQRGTQQGALFAFGRGGVPDVEGRTCTLWQDGRLVWVGILSGIQQQGPKWTFRARFILDAWQDKLKPEGLPAFALNHNPAEGGGNWWQGLVSPGDSSGIYPAIGPVQEPYYPPSYGWGIYSHGFQYLGTGKPEMTETRQNRATLAALGGEVFWEPNEGRYVTMPGGTPKYGWVDDEAMAVKINGQLHYSMAGQWLNCPDGMAGTVRKKIASVNVGTSEITLDAFTYSATGEFIDGRGGFSSNSPIAFRAASVVSAPSIPRLFYALLTSTGSGDNGDNDFLPGYLGFGLPAELVATETSYIPHDTIGGISAVDIGDVNLSDELEAAGCWLLWRGGRFAVRAVQIPSAHFVQRQIDAEVLATVEAHSFERAAVAPISCIVYEDAKGDKMTINIRAPQLWRPVAGSSKELRAKTRVGLPDVFLTGALISVAHWLSRYAPRARLSVVPGHGFELGDVAQFESGFLAGVGASYGGAVVAVVVGVSPVELELLLNTNPTTERILAPALRVVSASGFQLTILGGALQWAVLGGLDGDLALHNERTGEVQVVALAEIENDTTIQLTSAPTITAGDPYVLTLLTYDYYGDANKARYCFLADSVATLDGDPAHVYL